MDRRSAPVLLLALVALLATTTSASGASVRATQPATPQAAPAVAPPATPKVAAACARQVAAAAATADETTHVPHGLLELSGCVSDTSGIDHVVLRWNQDDVHGRICTDPVVNEGQWRCAWDTTRLPSGAYELELIAVDAAGNRGSSTRKYEIDDRQLEPRAPAEPAEPAMPRTDPEPNPTPEPAVPNVAPGQPLPDPTPSPAAPATDPTIPDDVPATEDPAAPEFSALQQLVVDRVEACETGGVDGLPTDDAAVTTQQEQIARVLECLEPALLLAGADATRLREEAPLPLAVVVEVADAAERTDLDAALPDTIAGVPVLVTEPAPPPTAT